MTKHDAAADLLPGKDAVGASEAGASEVANPIGDGDDGRRGKRPLEDDEEEVYFEPPPRFNENIIDEEKEEDSDDVGSDVESRHRKTRAILRKLQWGHYDGYWVGDKVSCPFCDRRIGTDFLSVMMHAESLGSSNVNVGEDVHVPSFMAKHATFGIFLGKLRNLAIEQGAVPPPKPKKEKKKGQGIRKWRRSQRAAGEM